MRVIVNGVSFYTTQQRVKDGVGDSAVINQAVRAAYGLVKWYKTNCVSTRVAVYDPKMRQQYFDVQIDKL